MCRFRIDQEPGHDHMGRCKCEAHCHQPAMEQDPGSINRFIRGDSIMAANRDLIKLDKIVKRYGELTVLSEVSLSVYEGEFLALLGPDRKSTRLNSSH